MEPKGPILSLRADKSPPMEPAAAADCLTLLVGLSTPFPKHQPLLTTLKRHIRLGANAYPDVASLADWWIVVAAGQRAEGPAWTLPQDIDPAILSFLETTRNRAEDGDDVPLLQRILQRRLFRSAVAQLIKALALSDSDTTKFGAEDSAWEELIEPLRVAVERLDTDPDDTDLPEIDDSTARKVMKKYGVNPGWPRWKRLLHRLKEARECRDRVTRLQADLRDLPAGLEFPPDTLTLPESADPVSRAVSAVLGPLFHDADAEIAATSGMLGAAVEVADPEEIDWLACLSQPWCESTGVIIGPLRHPIERLQTCQEQMRWLQSQGFPAELVQLNLDEGNLRDAESALDEEEARRRSSERRKGLESQIRSLRHSIEEEDEDSLMDALTELRDIEGSLDSQSLDVAYERFHRVSRQRDRARREKHITGLEELRDSFTSLGSRANAEEIAALLEDLNARPEKPVPLHAIQEAQSRLDELREELRERAVKLRDEGRRRVDNARQDLEAAVQTNIEALLDAADRALEASDLTAAMTEAQRAWEALERYIVPEWSAARDGQAALLEHVTAFIRANAGFSTSDIKRLFVALKTRRFAVLSGLTGSGKSTIARLFAEAFHATAENRRFVRIAVRPNWVDESEVLGYINPQINRFEPGWLATLMRACERDPNLPFFCLLDEMNLAPVEHYLADLLSAMEEASASTQPVYVQLYSPGAEPSNADLWPASIVFPSNLFILGTVNIDESTRALSDRVLDRANVIQLSVQIGREHHTPRSQDRYVSRRRVRMRDWQEICEVQGTDRHHDLLVEVADIFTQMRIGLGVRSHLEMERFIANAEGILAAEEALDLALLQRAVPKIRGFKRDLSAGLELLQKLAEDCGAERTVSVLDDWLEPIISDDMFLDGTDPRIGLVTSF